MGTPTRNPIRLACALGAVALAACASGGAEKTAHTRAPLEVLEHVAHERTPEGDAAVVVRDYVELSKADGRDVRFRVQYVWNYTRGVAQRRRWDQAGVAYQATDLPAMTLRANDDELEYAYSAVREDQRLAGKLTGDVQWYGGFSVREPGLPCQAPARCIHVIAMRNDGREKVLHAVFDLRGGAIVDPDYDPQLGGIGQSKNLAGEKK